MIAGSTVEMVGFEKQVTARGLAEILSMASELCPMVADAPVEQLWAGLRPYTEDHLPILGPAPQAGLFFASGHFRNGVLLAPITAQLVSEAVLGRPSAIDLTPFLLSRFQRQPSNGSK
jgi:glycine oxidase